MKQATHNEESPREFLELPVTGLSSDRRSFLKALGFGLASVSISACSRASAVKVLPYLEAPQEIIPGRAYKIATTCTGCSAGCGVLAKCKDGRPIKLEGNPEHPLSLGGLCAVGQAALLSLYDSKRLGSAQKAKDNGNGRHRSFETISLDAADRELRARFEEIRQQGGRVRILTGSINSPSTLLQIKTFVSSFKDARHVSYDPLSCSAIREAHEKTHGISALPGYRLDRAELIVSFDADFLGTWISPVSFARASRATQDLDGQRPNKARHVQLEARMSLTGTSADERLRLAPWERAGALTMLCVRLEEHKGIPKALETDALPTGSFWTVIENLARDLWKARGKSLVLCGSNSVDEQILTNYANHLLGNYGKSLDLEQVSLQAKGDDRALRALLLELEDGTVDLLLVSGANPVYDLPAALPAAIRKTKTLLSTAAAMDETARVSDYVIPEPHALEAWNDAEPVAGLFSLTQPTVPPMGRAETLRRGRTLRESLARWLGDNREDRKLLEDFWQEKMFPKQSKIDTFRAFFDNALRNGYVELPSDQRKAASSFRKQAIQGKVTGAAPGKDQLRLVLYPKLAMLAGQHAHNPWLQELPDPVTKVAWDNYACLSPVTAKRLGVLHGQMMQVSSEQGPSLDLPVLIQPGQHDNIVAVALGYGRAGTDRFKDIGPDWFEARATVEEGAVVGRNAAVFLSFRDGELGYDSTDVKLVKKSGRVDFACTQDHHSLTIPAHLAPKGHEVRDTVQWTTLAQYQENPAHAIHRSHENEKDLWHDDHKNDGPRWGMTIDLSACTGCSACVISCQAENNIPVVGKDEVRRHREMQWLRIDRYFQGDGDEVTTFHQPMMCQHCAHAPCETVCPVLATVHSADGLNQQIYNRCVGTRYCANNCPYKVRRFNWFNYSHDDKMQNMALNPDVTIRSRGVMEKCSMCIQRIQEAKAEARRTGIPVKDGDIQTACQQSCPSTAISFGDLEDPKSKVVQKMESNRAYTVLNELNVKPSVNYLANVRDHRNSRVEKKR